MLLRFRTENHRSIRDEQELSFIAAPLGDHTDALLDVESTDEHALPVIAVYGANASGKSSVLDALRFFRNAVRHSQREWNPGGGIPRQPFLLDSESVKRPSLYEAAFLVDDVRYQYGFVVNSERVLEEWLFAYPNGRKQELFVRDVSAKAEFKFSRELTGENRTIQKLTRPNSLFLSAAAQNNHEALSRIFSWIAGAIEVVQTNNRSQLWQTTLRLFGKPEYQSAVLNLLKMADLGVCGVEVGQEELPEVILRMLKAGWETDPAAVKRIIENPRIPKVALRHSTDAGDAPLPFDQESDGTRALFSLAGPIVRALATGRVLCVDEIDASLHPLLVLEVVKIFQDPDQNPRSSQLVFTTHDTNVLDAEVLRRDQIWFTEKDKSGATSLYPLTDFHPRKEENYERGYLQGRYGGIPYLSGAGELVSTLEGNG